MFSERDVLRWQEHRKDVLREAEQDRMARQALAGEGQSGLHRLALAWLGLFVTWECSLRRRYALGVLPGEGTTSLNSTSTQDCCCV